MLRRTPRMAELLLCWSQDLQRKEEAGAEQASSVCSVRWPTTAKGEKHKSIIKRLCPLNNIISRPSIFSRLSDTLSNHSNYLVDINAYSKLIIIMLTLLSLSILILYLFILFIHHAYYLEIYPGKQQEHTNGTIQIH